MSHDKLDRLEARKELAIAKEAPKRHFDSASLPPGVERACFVVTSIERREPLAVDPLHGSHEKPPGL